VGLVLNVRTHISRIQLALSVLGIALFVASVHADEWSLPTSRVYLSADKAWRLTVIPRTVTSQLAYFSDKVAGRQVAGAAAGDTKKHARGLMEHLDRGQWQPVWDEPLLNEVSPVEAIVSSSGQTVTFDNWHGMGFGKDVVVIYDDHGKLVRAMGLEDFLPKEYIEALPRSVSSIWWGSEHHFSADGKQLVLRVVVPSVEAYQDLDGNASQHIELRFDAATGQAFAPNEKAWSAALTSATKVIAENHAWEAKQKSEFIAPLLGPRGDGESDWHHYLEEAFFRVDPSWKNGYPATKILRLPKHKEYQASVGFLNDALHDQLNRDGVLMIASPSQDNLLHVLSEIAVTVPAGWLKKARVYVAVDDAHTAEAAKILLPTGAKYIQLDPSKPIPQRKARLDAMATAQP
jgi:hypothetical protein